MSRLLALASVVAVCCSTQVFAHDWSGFYFGAHAGATSTVDPADTTADLRGSDYHNASPGMIPLADLQALLGALGKKRSTGDFDSDGLIYGFQAGHNWQRGQFVFGVEADISNPAVGGDQFKQSLLEGFDLGGGDILDTISQEERSFDADYLATFRGRAGWAFDRLLVFGTGGLAVSDVTAAGRGTIIGQIGITEFGANQVEFSGRDTLIGWTLGGGVEYAVSDKISLKVEYLHADLGSLDIETFQLFGVPGESEMDVTFDTVRAGVNFRF